jgi:prepilin signal peptidase PulO-like enzyme (type II secretory pathway)
LIILFCTDLTDYILPDALQFPLMALGLLFAMPQAFWPKAAIVVSGGGWDYISASVFHNGLQQAPAWPQWYGAVTIKSSLLGLALGYAFPWTFNFAFVKIRNAIATKVFSKEPLESGMGMGDFKMLAWLGAFWGWEHMLGILFVAVVIMSVFVLPTHFLRKRAGNTMYPLGCGLALATPIVVFWGPMLWETYMGPR